MIKYVKGDLFDTEAQIIVHGCNCQGVMGSGVALAIKNKFPLAYELYRQVYEKDGLQLGNIIIADINPWAFYPERKVIVNALTQKYYGRDGKQYVSYTAIRSCLKQLKSLIKPMISVVIAMPKIGAGLGGGDWNIIEEIIKEELNEYEVKIYEL